MIFPRGGGRYHGGGVAASFNNQRGLLMTAVLMVSAAAAATAAQAQNQNTALLPQVVPQLNGQRFRITVIEEEAFLRIINDEDEDNPHHDGDGNRNNGRYSYAGYLIDMLEALALPNHANFTYELLSPSGYGSDCSPQLNVSSSSSSTADQEKQHHHSKPYRTQYNCGVNDVTEFLAADDDSSNNDTANHRNFVATDMYWGMYYISPSRQLISQFTVPFNPPYKGTPAMFGTATGIRNMEDLVRQQLEGKQPPVCMPGSTATLDFVQSSYPDLQIKPFYGDEYDLYESIASGECPIHVSDAPVAAQFVLRLSQSGDCYANNGKPIGVIGDPMGFGLSQYAIGIRKDMPREVVDTLSYWMSILMSCNPLDPDGHCPEGNLASFYEGQVGTGAECGYVLFPPPEDNRLLEVGAIAGIVVCAVALLVAPFIIWHRYRIKRQEKRFKKRFVQQIARNIEIGPSPGQLAPGKLSEEILHIGNGKDIMDKEDLRQWIHDIKMEFITEKDFDALWNGMDINGNGQVNAVEFIVFLSACGPEFEEVYNELEKMSKSERLKLAARRLTNIAAFGEAGVRRNEIRLERKSREFVHVGNSRGGDSTRSFNCPLSSTFHDDSNHSKI